MDSRKGTSLFIVILLSSFPIFLDQCDGRTSDVRTIEAGYHSSYEIVSILEQAAQDHPDVAEYQTAQDLLGTREILGDRVIPILFIGDRYEERPWVMLIGAHHGDEPDSAEAVLAFSLHLLDSYRSQDGRAIGLVDNINIAILPVVNPYGLDMLSRVDENGEDPNRDYPFEYAGVSSSTDGIPLTTAGASTIHDLASMYPFSIAISFHSGSKGIFYTWGAPNVGTETPDDVSFSIIGEELSRASGQNLQYGPANDFGYVANLEGAFDDHLYGSMFLADHLYSPSLQLPWSTFAATVELESVKGYHEDNLGDTEGLWDSPISDTGTVPRGVRICYSACMMAFPRLFVEKYYDNGTLVINATVAGAVDLEEIELLVDGKEVITSWKKDDYLPEWGMEVRIEGELLPGYHSVSLATVPDGSWNDLNDNGYPLISPQSLISRSRDDELLEWHSVFEVLNGTVKEPEIDGSIVFTNEELVLEASEEGYLEISLDWGEDAPTELVIIMEVQEWITVERYSIHNFRKGGQIIPFDLVPLVGMGNIIVNLSFPEGDIIEERKVTTLPGVEILSMDPVPGKIDRWNVMVGVTGGIGPTPLIWGVSRELDESWDTHGWSIPPQVEISSGYGPMVIEVDLSEFHGSHYFRVISADALEHYPYRMDKYTTFSPEGGLIIPQIPYSITGDRIILGPGLVVSRMDGLRSLDAYSNRVVYEVSLSGPEGNTTLVKLQWKQLSWLDEKELEQLEIIASMQGFRMDDITGAFFGEMEAPVKEGEYRLYMKVSGIADIGSGEYLDFSSDDPTDPFTIDEGEENEDDDGNGFPWALLIFLVMVAFAILIVTYFRYDSHRDEPEPEDEDIPLNRRGSYSAVQRRNMVKKDTSFSPSRNLRVVETRRSKNSRKATLEVGPF